MGDRLAEARRRGALAELPQLVRHLRAQAGELGDASHCGHAVTLLWDPPRTLSPAPPLRLAPPPRGA
jgi:hypothetical protein